MKTKEDIVNAISAVKHPAINYSLLDLGIVKNVEINNGKATVMFAFPFPNIPIADTLVNSVARPIEALGVGFKHEIVLMNAEEKARFMQMETEAWTG